MADRQNLLAAIRANPEDDTVRLAFADWCDENGEPDRAQFIRWSVARRHAETLGHREFRTYMLEEDAGQRRLVRPFPELDRAGAAWARVYRGFVSTIILTADNWLAHAGELLAWHIPNRVTLISVPRVSHASVVAPAARGRTGFHVVPGWTLRGESSRGALPVDLIEQRILDADPNARTDDSRLIAGVLLESEWPDIEFDMDVADPA